MLKFEDTQAAGRRAETEVVDILRRFTSYVYSNVVIDTLHTKSGHTEVDVIAAISDYIVVVEVKNIASISGNPNDLFWTLEGRETFEKYSTLNTFVQNRIHARALKDAWYKERGEFPKVKTFIVVPVGCDVPAEIKEDGVYTTTDFLNLIAKETRNNKSLSVPTFAYSLEYLIQKTDRHIVREDLGG